MRTSFVILVSCFVLWNLWGSSVPVDEIPYSEDTKEYADELYSRTVTSSEREIVVDLIDGLSEEEIADMSYDYGVVLLAESSASFDPYRIMVIRLEDPDLQRQDSLIEELNLDARVETAEINGVYRTTQEAPGAPNDPLFKYQWHLEMINSTRAWEYSMGENAVVAVIDTGVTHTADSVVEDLSGASFVSPFNFITNKDTADDDHGHGTHVAGTIAQRSNNGVGVAGVAPKASIMPLKVLSRFGSGTYADIAASIRYAADKGAHVINMSLGGPVSSKVLEDAVNYAHGKGVILVCAAGNSGPRKDSVGYPAAYANCVSVSSLDSTGGLAWYSSWGRKVDIAAPGGDTRSDRNGDGVVDGVLQNTVVPSDLKNKARYEQFQGTSMASPHVAGVAALLVSLGVKGTPNIMGVLRSTAKRKDDVEKYGAGMVDALAAVKLAKEGSLPLDILPLFGVPSTVVPVLREGIRQGLR